MTDLTEQWKKGELPEETECYVRVNGGIYLGSIRYKNGCHNKKLPYIKSFNGQFITKHVEEVLAEVPDYVEWQASENYIDYLKQCISVYESKDKQATETSIAYNKLAEENIKLKELLKECRNILEEQTFCRNTILETDETLRTRIIKKAEILTKIYEVLK